MLDFLVGYSLFSLVFLVVELIIILMFLLIINLLLVIILLKLTGVLVKFLSKNKYKEVRNDTLDKKSNPFFTIGFMHPFCHSGGGGERVLWSAVKILQDT